MVLKRGAVSSTAGERAPFTGREELLGNVVSLVRGKSTVASPVKSGLWKNNDTGELNLWKMQFPCLPCSVDGVVIWLSFYLNRRGTSQDSPWLQHRKQPGLAQHGRGLLCKLAHSCQRGKHINESLHHVIGAEIQKHTSEQTEKSFLSSDHLSKQCFFMFVLFWYFHFICTILFTWIWPQRPTQLSCCCSWRSSRTRESFFPKAVSAINYSKQRWVQLVLLLLLLSHTPFTV